MDYSTLNVVIIVAISYLLGSIPTAYLAAKTKKINIFEVGSGNMGATNAIRSMGWRWGAAVLLFDIFKGVAAIYISRQIMHDSKAAATTISAISVTIGHNWSLFATILTGTLRGGKGAATAFGTLLMIAPFQVIVAAVFIGGVIVARTRLVSLAVLTTFFFALVWMIVLIILRELESWVIIYALTIAALLLVRFRENIQRLLAGTERRLGDHA